MQYGFFDDNSQEYVITNPKTPVKWVNYIGTLDFGGIVDQTGGALLCRKDPALNRITKVIPQLPASDFRGTTTYLKANRGGEKSLHSPFFSPCLVPYDRYECRVGLSYQKIVSVTKGIRSEVTIFVPLGAQAEVRIARFTNIEDTAVELDVIPVVEYSHFDALKQFTNADWVPQTMQCKAHWKENRSLVVSQAAFMKWNSEVNFFGTPQAVDSFETDRQCFLGENGYGSWAHPKALDGEHLSNTEALRGDVMTALMIKRGVLEPGASTTVITVLGQAEPNSVQSWMDRYQSEELVLEALAELKQYWSKTLAVFQCETPSEALNSMVNVHNPRQCQTTLNWSRYLSLYQLGLGSDRGIGFRDSSQDVMGAIALVPEQSKALLMDLLSVQKADGSAMHQYFPLTMEANEGDSREESDKQTYGDDHLWIVLAVSAYLREHGDHDLLQVEVPFYSKTLELAQRERGTVLEHLMRALDYTKHHCGKKGLPLLGFADWNDTVNLAGEAESCMIACMYGKALLDMIELCDHIGRQDLAAAYRQDHQDMKVVFNREAWNGKWYTRYFTEDGEPLGSHENEQGQIYTNAQSWAILANFDAEGRGEKVMDAVREKLNTKFGIKLSAPGYDRFDPEKGGVTTYPPGAKENGGIFLHSNPWVIIAETKCGRGEVAFEYYDQINPAAKNEIMETYEAEPYCYPQNILGDEHPQFGLARNTWLSGTASWLYQAASQHILGVRPTLKGLCIDPCIPAAWKSYKVTRWYRGKHYHIEVHNPEGLHSGVKSIVCNGEECEGAVLPLDIEAKDVHVVVTMG